MSHCNTLSRRLIAPLAVAAIAAPAATATAQPLDYPPQSGGTSGGQHQRYQDLRSADAQDAARPDLRPAPGQPQWPAHPQPLSPSHHVTVLRDDGGTDWTIPIVATAGGLLVLGAGFGAARIRLRSTRPGVAH